MNKIMSGLKWLAMTSLVVALTACGGGTNQRPSDASGTPVSDAERAMAEANNSALQNNTIPPDEGAPVEVLGAGGGAEINASDVAAGEPLDNQTDTEQQVEPVPQVFEPVLFFGYDQYDITEASLSTIKHYAEILMDNEQLKLTLVGHTDERGTPEYNLALGERRGNASKDAFMLFGVANKRIEVVSMGEEQPLVDAHNEEAYAKNRRVEIGIH